MSVDVTNLCRRLQMTPAQKCVLMALADRADDGGIGWPSIPRICEWTCFGRTAVIEALKWLEAQGFVQVSKVTGRNNLCAINLDVVRQLAPPNPSAQRTTTSPADGRVTPPSPVLDTTNAAVNQSASQTGPAGEPVRETDPHPSAQRTTTSPADGPTRPAGGPDTSLNTNKTSIKTKTARGEPRFDPMSIELPAWLPVDAWAMWVRNRIAIKKPMGEDAVKVSIHKLAKLREAGHDPAKVIEHNVLGGWQGLFPAKDGSTLAKPGSSVSHGETGWLAAAGFSHIAEAQNARCHIGNYREFRDGKRITAEVTA